MNGKKIAYIADAQVYYSHSYSWNQDFKRYFDIGVLHERAGSERDFGSTGGEGLRFVKSEISYLWSGNKRYIPSAFVRTILKFCWL